MAKHIVVLSDGTWEALGAAEVLEITDDAFEQLSNGTIEPSDLQADDVLSETPLHMMRPSVAR